jgi:hypothetical protein
MIGHIYTEHGDSIHAPEILVFKDPEATWVSHNPGRGRGSCHGQCGGFRSEHYSK